MARCVEYDPETDRYWDGDRPLPRSPEEARRMGLQYDGATEAYWSGDTLVARQSDVDRHRRLTRDGVVRIEDDEDGGRGE